MMMAVASQAAPPPGVVAGGVKDADGRPLAGARLRLETTAGDVVGTTTADDQGAFTFREAPPGTYRLVVDREGFEPVSTIVTVAPAHRTTVDPGAASRRPQPV